MRKSLFKLSVLSIFVLIINSVKATDLNELDVKIRRVKSYLEQPGGPALDGDAMFTLLLETILQAAPDTGYPPEFAETIENTKRSIDPKSKFNPDAFVYLNKAFRLINSGQDFRMPDTILGIQDTINHARMVLAQARESLKPGRVDIGACAKNLVFVALLIMSPMHP